MVRKGKDQCSFCRKEALKKYTAHFTRMVGGDMHPGKVVAFGCYLPGHQEKAKQMCLRRVGEGFAENYTLDVQVVA